MQGVVHPALPLALEIHAAEQAGKPAKMLARGQAGGVEMPQGKVEHPEVVGEIHVPLNRRPRHDGDQDRGTEHDPDRPGHRHANERRHQRGPAEELMTDRKTFAPAAACAACSMARRVIRSIRLSQESSQRRRSEREHAKSGESS